MIKKWDSIKKPVAYCLFVLAVASLFLYISFPSQSFRHYLEAKAARIIPGLSMDIGEARFQFPVGINLQRAVFTGREQPTNILFKADSFVVMPSLKTLTEWQPTIDVDCRAYGGVIKGSVVFAGRKPRRPLRSDFQAEGIRLDRYEALQEMLKRDCSGVMSGTVHYVFHGTDLLNGSGKGEIFVSNGKVQFAESFLGLPALDFDQIEAQLVLEDRDLVVQQLAFDGDQIDGEGSGKISLDPVFERSTLDLSFRMRPSPGFSKEQQELADAAFFFLNRSGSDRVTIAVRGTVAQPRVTFNGRGR